MDKLVEKFKLLRKGTGLSQEEFARRIGVSRQTVIKWENGTVYPSVQYALKICEEFSISPDAFWDEDSDILALLSKAEQQAAIAEKNRKAFSVKKLVLNSLLILAFLYLTVIAVIVAVCLICVLAPNDADASVLVITFSTSPGAIAIYIIAGVLAIASLFIITRYCAIKTLKRRKLGGEK